ncbi:MAG: class I SAM-dependent methyltransferase [Candidatus Freyarchaeum deiterrae]
MGKKPKPNYGVDTPWGITMLSAVTVFFIFYIVLLPELFWKIVGFISLSVSFIGLLRILFGTTYSAKIKLREKIIRIAQPRENNAILDVGTGRGLLAIGFAKALKKCEVIGVDIWAQRYLSGNRIENAMQNARLEKVSTKVEFKMSDVRQLPFPDKYFDVVVCRYVITNVRDGRLEALAEMVRVMKPNGRLVMAELGWPLFWSKRMMKETLGKLGISSIQFYPRGINGYITYGERKSPAV